MTPPKQSAALVAPRTDGRLIISYPKSGRTWIRFALQNFDIDATLTHAGSATNRRQIGRAFETVPEGFKDVPLVFLHRNPFDTAVSMFYQINKRDLRPWSRRWIRMAVPLLLRSHLPPTEINRFVLDPVYGIKNICAYNRAWLDHLSTRKDCLVLSYEEMRKDPAAGFQLILDQFDLSAPTGKDLADVSTFSKMKAFEASQTADANLALKNQNDPQSAKVRRGKVGGYKDELSADTVKACEAIVASYGF